MLAITLQTNNLFSYFSHGTSGDGYAGGSAFGRSGTNAWASKVAADLGFKTFAPPLPASAAMGSFLLIIITMFRKRRSN